MNTNKYIVWCACCITILIGIISIVLTKHTERTVISTPVEEMYHRQLVTTIDSILDARFGPGCCEDFTDTDSDIIIYDSICRVSLPNK